MDDFPFHQGEIEARHRAGVVLHGHGIRDWMTEQHRMFFALLPFVVVGAASNGGFPLATIITSEPGFVSSPDPYHLDVRALPAAEDPAAPGFRAGLPVALLGIDLATRRRNRLNGVIAARDEAGFEVAVMQSFGNCPQYIQARLVSRSREEPKPGVQALNGLDDEARGLIRSADTFFVASGSTDGLDVSHRGGRAGFVRVEGDRLLIPDFRGNRYFNTLGNLLLHKRAGLLFPDFATGDLLQLAGDTEVLWDQTGGFPGAERLWRLQVVKAWRRRAALGLRWDFQGFAPTTELAGSWSAEPI